LYIACPFGLIALLEKQEETTTTYFIETDHLGSIIGLINTDKSYAEHFSFDPWGRRRNPNNWSYNSVPQPNITDRGFTGHEHLDQFGLINMNGRMYDPVVGRFLGVDPVIQAPEFSQSYNGYNYCFNNPIFMVDITGYESLVINNTDENKQQVIASFLKSLINNQGSLTGLFFSSDWSIEEDFESEFLDNLYGIMFESKGDVTQGRLSATKDHLAEVLTLALKIKFDKYDAILFSADPDGIFGYWKYNFNLAKILMITGPDSGKSSQIEMEYKGYGFDLSLGFQVSKIFYTRFSNLLRLTDIEGYSRSLSAGFSFMEAGISVSEELVIGGRLVSIDAGLSLSPFPAGAAFKETNIKIFLK
jgi:RHS repeat-associated protein